MSAQHPLTLEETHAGKVTVIIFTLLRQWHIMVQRVQDEDATGKRQPRSSVQQSQQYISSCWMQ
jgi:hypothetical protein